MQYILRKRSHLSFLVPAFLLLIAPHAFSSGREASPFHIFSQDSADPGIRQVAASDSFEFSFLLLQQPALPEKGTLSFLMEETVPAAPVSNRDTSADVPAMMHMKAGPEKSEAHRLSEEGFLKNHQASNWTRLKRAELLSLASQLAGMGILQAVDAWDTGHRPFANAGKNLRRAWTSAPGWDEDAYYYNYIGHPYTGAFTYNLMRSQNASPLASWLFSCSQSVIWEYTFEATEQHPSIQDLLITSNVGSLMGEGFHRLTGKLRKNGLSPMEKILVLLINPGHVMNNGFR